MSINYKTPLIILSVAILVGFLIGIYSSLSLALKPSVGAYLWYLCGSGIIYLGSHKSGFDMLMIFMDVLMILPILMVVIGITRALLKRLLCKR
jgi:hypothetical protein